MSTLAHFVDRNAVVLTKIGFVDKNSILLKTIHPRFANEFSNLSGGQEWYTHDRMSTLAHFVDRNTVVFENAFGNLS